MDITVIMATTITTPLTVIMVIMAITRHPSSMGLEPTILLNNSKPHHFGIVRYSDNIISQDPQPTVD